MGSLFFKWYFLKIWICYSSHFNNINDIQTLGTTLGNKMAPTYVTLTLAYLEESLYEIIDKNKIT